MNTSALLGAHTADPLGNTTLGAHMAGGGGGGAADDDLGSECP